MKASIILDGGIYHCMKALGCSEGTTRGLRVPKNSRFHWSSNLTYLECSLAHPTVSKCCTFNQSEQGCYVSLTKK